MTATFDVERFEHVAATAETALLRLSGRWRADQRERLSPPMLVVDDGRRTHRLAALPGPEDAAPLAGPDPPRVVDDGRRTHRLAALPGPEDAAPLAGPDPPRWRAAFSAPADFLGGSHRPCALDAGSGVFVALPRPQPARRGRPAPPAPAPAVSEAAAPRVDPRARVDAEKRARERREAMRELE